MLELSKSNDHPVDRDSEHGVKISECFHAGWIGEAAMACSDCVADHTEKIPAIPPAGLGPLFGMQCASRCSQSRLLLQQMPPGRIHKSVRFALQQLGQCEVGARGSTDQLQFVLAEWATFSIGGTDAST